MQYFFMTAGSSTERDYAWWKSLSEVTQRATTIDLPRLDVNSYPNFADWLDGDPTNFSLLLAHSIDNRFLLVISNLETKRRDYQQRMIRNSIMLVSDGLEEERTIRLLAAASLDKWLVIEIADALEQGLTENVNSGENWVQFNEGFWENFLESKTLTGQASSCDWEVEESFCIAKDSNERREEIRSFLLNEGKKLPNNKILIIVTGFKGTDFYKRHAQNLWLVLTKIVVSEEWQSISKNAMKEVAEHFNKLYDFWRKPIQRRTSSALMIFLATTVLLSLAFELNPWRPAHESETPTQKALSQENPGQKAQPKEVLSPGPLSKTATTQEPPGEVILSQTATSQGVQIQVPPIHEESTEHCLKKCKQQRESEVFFFLARRTQN